jgi:crotonobetainyl-CoA:carnitine CoA-transferase CaiB-like acyl-CoA transferase
MTGGTLGIEGEWWEHSVYFLASNTNKRGLTLDLTTTHGLDILKRLIAKSDVLIENFSPRVLPNFGLDWEGIQELNRRCLLVRMPAFGLSGPWRDNTGFAQTMEQVTGLAWLTGHRDDQPRIQSGPSDPNAGMHAAFAMLVGLAEREATGEGCHLEVSMVEGALNAAAEMVIERTAYGNRLQRDGNRGPNVAPQGLYACRGFDEWLAISVANDCQWESLVRAIGAPDWAPAAELATYEGRQAKQDDLDAWLSSWCADQDAVAACELLGDHGVPAGVGWDPRTMLEHPQLRHRKFYEDIDHPLLGTIALPSLPFRFASTPTWLRSAAPTLGQHNRQILQDELGIGQEEYEDLETRGVIGQTPQGL